jgi:hypothetical protein
MKFALDPSRDAATTRHTTALSKSFYKGSNMDTYFRDKSISIRDFK